MRKECEVRRPDIMLIATPDDRAQMARAFTDWYADLEMKSKDSQYVPPFHAIHPVHEL